MRISFRLVIVSGPECRSRSTTALLGACPQDGRARNYGITIRFDPIPARPAGVHCRRQRTGREFGTSEPRPVKCPPQRRDAPAGKRSCPEPQPRKMKRGADAPRPGSSRPRSRGNCQVSAAPQSAVAGRLQPSITASSSLDDMLRSSPWAQRILSSISLDISACLLQEHLGVLPSLADPLVAVGIPGAGFLDHAGLDAKVQDLAGLGNPLAVHDVEFDLLERRRDLVLHHLDPGTNCRPPRRGP